MCIVQNRKTHIYHLPLITTTKTNTLTNTKKQLNQPIYNHLLLIECMHTMGLRHQSEKEKHVDEILEVTWDQTFNWVREKIYEWSITPPLKMCLFLCFKISLTNAIQTFPKIILTNVGASCNLNGMKCEIEAWLSTNLNANHV